MEPVLEHFAGKVGSATATKVTVAENKDGSYTVTYPLGPEGAFSYHNLSDY